MKLERADDNKHFSETVGPTRGIKRETENKAYKSKKKPPSDSTNV